MKVILGGIFSKDLNQQIKKNSVCFSFCFIWPNSLKASITVLTCITFSSRKHIFGLQHVLQIFQELTWLKYERLDGYSLTWCRHWTGQSFETQEKRRWNIVFKKAGWLQLFHWMSQNSGAAFSVAVLLTSMASMTASCWEGSEVIESSSIEWARGGGQI